jgi:hypothetical protein
VAGVLGHLAQTATLTGPGRELALVRQELTSLRYATTRQAAQEIDQRLIQRLLWALHHVSWGIERVARMETFYGATHWSERFRTPPGLLGPMQFSGAQTERGTWTDLNDGGSGFKGSDTARSWTSSLAVPSTSGDSCLKSADQALLGPASMSQARLRSILATQHGGQAGLHGRAVRKEGRIVDHPAQRAFLVAGRLPAWMRTPSVSKPKRRRSRSVTHSPGAVPMTRVAGSWETSWSKLATSLAESRS